MTPPPLTQVVLKVHSRCDLACDHCYVYEHADTGWRSRPRVVRDAVLGRTAERIGEHAVAHGLTAVRVVLHGGEPLLAGSAVIRRAAEALRAALPEVCDLDLRVHTNGVRLNRAYCELFDELGIRVGLSLDGDRAANDRHRRFADGRSSHPQVLRAVGLLREPRFRHLFAGLLCTVDAANDPVAVYRALAELEPPAVDFLLPHATWERPPERPDRLGATPYADWLLAVHARWEADGRPFAVRTFDSVHRTLSGLPGLSEALGLEPVDLVVLETDGTYEQADSLRTAYDGAPATGMDVFRHSLDDVLRHPGIAARQAGPAGLSATCRACPVVRSCGGGLYAHRYRDGSFEHPSVYCADLRTLIDGLAARAGTVARAAPSSVDVAGPGLTDAQLGELALGLGGPETVRSLARSQLALTRAMLAAVHGSAGLARSAAWELLTELDAAAPVAVDAVVAHPYVRSWAARRLTGDPGAGLGPLAELAASAAVLAGRGDVMTVPVRDGTLHLPTLGRLVLGGGVREARVTGGRTGWTARTDDGALTGPGDPRWQPVRRIGSIALEDVDPQRAAHRWPVADRLSDTAYAGWARDLRAAADLLDRELPDYAAGLWAGLTTITPLRPGPDGHDLSSAARQAFGAVAIARPRAAPTLALLLVHEFQHVKLGAVLDRWELYDRTDTRLFEAFDLSPRPIGSLFQAVYAHLAVTAFWGTRANAGSPTARSRFTHWRALTDEAVDLLAGSGALTPMGERFAAGARASVDPWLLPRASREQPGDGTGRDRPLERARS
ncbi:FxsB family cyclophane-forming radical SAM/SPASM peptide maturase [Kitasatospora sp. NPDC097605]|uniref:FxsB family cyclophane-forming radical SAM/SPASM peptide maturase n=1 Tax=Kitasatospora sp. NPDC097605 TaxID=3157226 RepID=UPI0033204ADF